jgi:hypothetical protein
MPDYSTMHRNRIADAVRIPKSKLERGMVAKIRYKKVSGEARDYYVFVLQPKFKGYFHCLDLKHIAPPQMVKLAEDLNEVLSITSKVKKLDLTKLNLDASSKKFYLNEIRNKKLKNGYRTLIEKNISTVMVYNYDYGIFDKVDTEANRRQREQVEKDDTPDFLEGI